MPNLELRPEIVEQFRMTEPLACPRCYAESGRSNYNLSVIDHGTSMRQTGIMVRCSAGHTGVAAFVPRDGLVFHGIVAVDSHGGGGGAA